MMNQGYNPLEPEYGPNAFNMLQSYREKAAQLRGELQQDSGPSYNPYQPEQEENESQGKHISEMEQWLSPVKMDTFDPTAAYSDDKHDNFMQNLEQDPAVKEYGEQFYAYLESLMSAVNAGQIDNETAMQMGQNYLDNVVKPIITKHHSKEDKGSLHKKREPEIPDIVKKVRGVK